jgi:3-hydroxy acid dehydrogenase / malonic semialdehyde reductase
LQYKTAVISGASSGIGKAVAEKLANLGVRLILVARRKEKLIELTDSLNSSTVCHIAACDLADLQSVQKAFEQLPEEFMDIDVLVNSAGLALGLETAQQAEWSSWQTTIDVNCTGLAYLTHRVLPNMVGKNVGHIVNIGSIAGSYPYKGGNVYGATKAFVEQFTLNLKADLLGTSVKVSNIEPGMVANSEFSLVRFKGDAEKAANVYDGIDALKPADIANAVVWVLTQPAHVNVNRVELMPVSQAPSRTAFFKTGQS